MATRAFPRLRPVLAIIAVLAAAPAAAHHGWGSYDSENPLTITGTLQRVAFDNPHVIVDVQTADATWVVALAPVSRMNARGATAEVIATGKTVEAYGYPSREHAREMRAERITVDGRTYELR